MNFPPPRQPSGVENLLHTTTISMEEEGPRAAAPKGHRRRAVASAGYRLHSGLHLSIKLLITLTMCE